jgi:hypothetical protein
MPRKKDVNGHNGNAQFRQVKLTFRKADAQSVSVAGNFCGWQTDGYPLKRDRKGMWITKIMLSPGCYHDRFVLEVSNVMIPTAQSERRMSSAVKIASCIYSV